MSIEFSIKGSSLITDVYGRWPSFHDAEVVRLSLERDVSDRSGPVLLADIHAFEMLDAVDERGCFVLAKHRLVSFCFESVEDLSLLGFSGQNALFDLTIREGHAKPGRNRYEVTLSASYGVSATFVCGAIEIVGVRDWSTDPAV